MSASSFLLFLRLVELADRKAAIPNFKFSLARLAVEYLSEITSINIRRSGTRREDLLTSPEELQRMFILRKILDDMEDSQAIEFLIERLKSSKTNDEFFSAMKSGNGNGKKK